MQTAKERKDAPASSAAHSAASCSKEPAGAARRLASAAVMVLKATVPMKTLTSTLLRSVCTAATMSCALPPLLGEP